MAALTRRQRTGRLAVYKFRTVEELDEHIRKLRKSVNTVQYAAINVKADLDMLLDARLALMKQGSRGRR